MKEEGQFRVTLPLMKSWEDSDGVMRFEGVAASTSLDRQHERMTQEAMAKMEEYNDLDLLPSHSADALSEIGQIEKCWVDNDQFRVAGRLDGSSEEGERLYEKLQAGKNYGLSVGGRVLKAHWDYDEEAGQKVKYIDDVALDHIALCRPSQAANPDTYLTALAKAAEEVLGASAREFDGQQSNAHGAGAQEFDERQSNAHGAGAQEFDKRQSNICGAGVGEADKQASDISAESQEAAFARLGRGLVKTCQKLWPFGAQPALAKSDEQAADEESPEDVEALRRRIEELSGAVETLGDEVEELRKSDEKEDEPDQIEPGRPQAIPGQNVTNQNTSMWKGVL